ncbi:MAG: deoxyribonuclease V [bacterium]
MKCNDLHPWELSYKEAIKVQRDLSSKVILEPFRTEVRLIAGADVSYSKGSDIFFAGVIVMEIPSMKIIEEASADGKVDFPYIPGLLSFRESPVLIKALEKIQNIPDVVIFDGQGIAHPRRLGIASHLGLIIDLPSIGCAKNILVGKYEDVGVEAGDYSPIVFNGNIVGAALRTKRNVLPVFVSPGHKIDISSSLEIVMNACKGYRLPEPVRQAHILVNKIRAYHHQTM